MCVSTVVIFGREHFSRESNSPVDHGLGLPNDAQKRYIHQSPLCFRRLGNDRELAEAGREGGTLPRGGTGSCADVSPVTDWRFTRYFIVVIDHLLMINVPL